MKKNNEKDYDLLRLNELYNNTIEGQAILIENKDYFSEKDFNRYNDKFNEILNEINIQILNIIHESSKGTH